MSEFDPVSFIMGAKSAGGGGGGGGGGGEYDIVLRLNTIEGDLQSITQISMDINAVIAKAEALQPITALVYHVDQVDDFSAVSTVPVQPNYRLNQGSLDELSIFVKNIDRASGYSILVYDLVGDEWYED